MTKNILIVVDNLVMGGVTRVLSNMLRELSKNDEFKIDLLAIHRHSDMAITFPENVNILEGSKALSMVDCSMVSLLKTRDIRGIISKFLLSFKIKTGLIKKEISRDRGITLSKKYDIEIAFGDGFPYFYVGLGNSKTKIAWMHSDVLVLDYSARYYRQIKKILSLFDEYVAVSDKVADSYNKKYAVSNIKVIPNIINKEEIINKSKVESVDFGEGMNFISVGRLDYSKNYEMLIRVCKRLVDQGYNFKTHIIGDGPEQEKLQNLIFGLNLKENVFLLGRKDNPYPYVKASDVFLLSSRYEGLPTVIIEALVLQRVCISTEVAGAYNLIGDNYGIVTKNDEEAFFESIKAVLDDKGLLKAFNKNVGSYDYDNNYALKEIEKLLS